MIPIGTICIIVEPRDPWCGGFCEVVSYVCEPRLLSYGTHRFDIQDGRRDILGHEWQVRPLGPPPKEAPSPSVPRELAAA